MVGPEVRIVFYASRRHIVGRSKNVKNKTTFDALNVRWHILDMMSGKTMMDKKRKQTKLISNIPPTSCSRCLSFSNDII